MDNKFPVTVIVPIEDAMATPLHRWSGVEISGNCFEGNSIAGDLKVIGVQQNNIFPQNRNPNALIALIERSKRLSEESLEYRNMLDELQSFLTTRSDRTVIGLEAKLAGGGRPDLVEDALYLEGRFARRLAQGQHSPSTIAMFLHCLSAINSAFSSYIMPLIKIGETHLVVDAAIKLHVIDPIYEELVNVDCSLNVQVVRGMLYFLTGKCHIMWK